MSITRIRNTFTGKNSILRYLGPGLLVTVGFIDPGNWASNVAAGSYYGYSLLWIVSLSTLMLIVLQHNAAHLGIATGMCHAEAATKYLPSWVAMPVLVSAMVATVSTALAEILGAAIALTMLFHIPFKIGACISTLVVCYFLFGSSYKKLEKIIIGFVSLIGLSFFAELILVKWNIQTAAMCAVVPDIPHGSMPLIMSVLGAVVMPHNLFLHSEVIQSRQWNLTDDKTIRFQLRNEIFDTFFSMVIGWGINCAMIILAAATFFKSGIKVDALAQAQTMLVPIAGHTSALIFALGLMFAGIASSITAGMAGATIFTGMFGRSYDVKDMKTLIGVMVTLLPALIIIFFVKDTFQALLVSQMVLSIQLPVTVCLQIYLTTSKKVMGKYANPLPECMVLCFIALIIIVLNVMLFRSFYHS